MPRTAAVLRELADLGDDLSIEVNDKTTLLAVGPWARERGVRTVLLSHERLDRWIEARVPRLWRAGVGHVLKPAVRGWNKGLANRFDTVVVTSAYAEREFAGLPVPLRRIPLGVDLDTFQPRVSETPAIARLVYAGRLSHEKNPRAVVGAVRVLRSQGVPVRLDVYGDGPGTHGLAQAGAWVAGGVPRPRLRPCRVGPRTVHGGRGVRPERGRDVRTVHPGGHGVRHPGGHVGHRRRTGAACAGRGCRSGGDAIRPSRRGPFGVVLAAGVAPGGGTGAGRGVPVVVDHQRDARPAHRYPRLTNVDNA
jgi:hypothetical protein